MRTREECEVHVGALGGKSYLNKTAHYILLRKVSLRELREFMAEFQKILFDWGIEQLTNTTEELNAAGELTIEAFKAYNCSSKQTAPHYNQTYFRIAQISREAWAAIGQVMPLRPNSRERVIGLSTENQIALIKAIFIDLSAMHEMILPRRETEFVYAMLWQELSDAKCAIDFLLSLIRRSDIGLNIKDFRRIIVKGAEQAKHSCIPDAFIFFLSDRGVLLRPFHRRPFQAFARDLDIYALTPQTRSLYNQLLADYAVKFKRSPPKGKRRCHFDNEPPWLKHFRLDFFSVLFCTTLRNDRQLTSRLFESYTANLGTFVANHLLQFNRFFYEDVRARSASRDDIPSYDKTASSLTTRFEWVRVSYSSKTSKIFPTSLLENYTPRANIIDWTDFFMSRIPLLEVKSSYNVLSAVNLFLAWLAVTNNPACRIADLDRAMINDSLPPERSQCFRAFLQKRKMTEQSLNGHLGRLSGLFQAAIDEDQIPIRNPIIFRLDRLRQQVRRGKTPRVALGAEMLHYIRAFNAKDAFAFSKSRPAHQRYVVGEDGITYGYRWYPGVAILIDFLLRIPVRGFQARYLDSGEGDELLPDLETPDLAMRPNPASTATKQRKEFVLTAITATANSALLGLYINTNKTAVDREAGYEIPWCDEELKNNILFMASWQRKHNPISRPVPCAEKGRLPDNPAIIAMLKESYPLFRDPSEDGFPMTRDTIYRYWDDLTYAVELQIAAENPDGPRVQLTDEVVVQKSKGKTERRHVSRYDIHTLRVSGITALIDAGLPPNMVADVAGHSTIVMTLYYNKTAASTLNARLAAAIEATTATLNDFGHLSGEDFESVTEYLINHRDAEDQRGLEMLKERRGIGDGSITVMAHGICPGGECSTGGKWTNQAVGHMPVPRPLACSLCRYRLTGPMFLSGLVANTNKLLFELRRCGEEIAAFNNEAQKMSAAGKPVRHLKAQIASLNRQTDILGEEWAAEYGYALRAAAMLSDYLARPQAEQPNVQFPVLTALDAKDVEVRLERKSGFALLQQLSESVQSCPGFRPEQALQDHREFLNEVLCANDMEPLLLRLAGPMRDVAANLLGRAITAAVPDERIADLKHSRRLDDYPIVQETIDRIEVLVVEANRRDEKPLGDTLTIANAAVSA